jgi:hypothetical protein
VVQGDDRTMVSRCSRVSSVVQVVGILGDPFELFRRRICILDDPFEKRQAACFPKSRRS